MWRVVCLVYIVIDLILEWRGISTHGLSFLRGVGLGMGIMLLADAIKFERLPNGW